MGRRVYDRAEKDQVIEKLIRSEERVRMNPGYGI